MLDRAAVIRRAASAWASDGGAWTEFNGAKRVNPVRLGQVDAAGPPDDRTRPWMGRSPGLPSGPPWATIGIGRMRRSREML